MFVASILTALVMVDQSCDGLSSKGARFGAVLF
jgi:hypothetical protein